MFVFDLETSNDQEFAEAYATGLYDVNRLRDRVDRELTRDEIKSEKNNVIVLDESYANLIMITLKYIPENYEEDEKTYIDKDGDELFSSFRLFLVAHNASGFDSWIVLNSLVKEIIELKIKNKLLEVDLFVVSLRC